MFEATNPGWLADLLDRAFSGHVLRMDECQELAAGFVGCNLAANLAEFVANLANGASGSVVGGSATPSFAQLRGFFLHPPRDWSDLALLTGPGGAAAMAGGPRHFDPWWQINRWLGVEAFLRILASNLSSAGTAPSVFPHARATAERVLAASGLRPEPCRRQNPAAAQAFGDWWHATVDCLVALWQQHGWHQQGPLVRQRLGDLLARALAPTCPQLTTLVGARNNQLWNCMQQLNQASGPCPTPDGWLARLGGEVLGAWEAGDDFAFTPIDLQHLNTLAEWLPAAGLAQRQLELRKLFAAFLPPAVEAHFPNPYLREVLGLLNDLSAEIPTRGLPSHWPDRPLTADLFAYPVHPGLDFTVWASTLHRLDGIPRQRV